MVIKENFLGKDVVSIDDFSIEEINYILDLARGIKENPGKYSDAMSSKIMAPLFFEPSTRTSSSFQAAMMQMDGKVLDFDVGTSSIKKGETLRDTVKTMQGYDPEVVVVRHKKDGSAKFVADILEKPVINAGDGQNQHPTQTLLDLFTIKEIRGEIGNAKIAIAGDLKYGRTAHSLALALARYENCKLKFVSPESLKMPLDFLEKLKTMGCCFSEHDLSEFKKVIEECDVVYVTRVQRERFPESLGGELEYKKVVEKYHLTMEMLDDVNENFKIMHPLPKVDEIQEEIDNTKYAYYFQQAKNGLYIRKALLLLILGERSQGIN
jgi:aspartate carbamoyltransferase catalytic subunit